LIKKDDIGDLTEDDKNALVQVDFGVHVDIIKDILK